MTLTPLFTATMTTETMKETLVLLVAILAVLVISTIIFTIAYATSKKGSAVLVTVLWIATVFWLICCLLCQNKYTQVLNNSTAVEEPQETEETVQPQPEQQLPVEEEEPTEETEPTVEETEPPTQPEPTLAPAHTEDTDPANQKVNWYINNGSGNVDTYQREDKIYFGQADDYYALAGVPTFRGNNYRTDSTYGTAQVESQSLSTVWTRKVGGFNDWYGVGWTGQPLVVQWDAETRQILGLYESKKNKENLVEVITTTLDGNIYFYDLEDGSYTRDPFYLGMNVKGTASLDPRGWPILYVGSGIPYNGAPKMFVISLLDNTLLYKQDGSDSFAKRGWYAFDSSPMICGDADTVIWPGESGVLYTLKLNTQYDPAAATLSVAPETVAKTCYTTGTGRTVGYESSVIIVEQYAFIGDNGGKFFCIDLNTMELMWAQDVGDDLNATPVFEWGDDGIGYIYLGTSMEYGQGTSRVFKINANTGEIVWERPFHNIYYNKDVSGGVLSSPLLGKKGTNLEGLIVFAIGKTPNDASGILVALDTETDEIVHEYTMRNYAWSSIAAFYTEDGKTYIALGDSAGNVRLFDAQLNVLSTVNIGSNIEASPVVFNDMLVVGTRGGSVCGIKIS